MSWVLHVLLDLALRHINDRGTVNECLVFYLLCMWLPALQPNGCGKIGSASAFGNSPHEGILVIAGCTALVNVCYEIDESCLAATLSSNDGNKPFVQRNLSGCKSQFWFKRGGFYMKFSDALRTLYLSWISGLYRYAIFRLIQDLLQSFERGIGLDPTEL